MKLNKITKQHIGTKALTGHIQHCGGQGEEWLSPTHPILDRTCQRVYHLCLRIVILSRSAIYPQEYVVGKKWHWAQQQLRKARQERK